MAASREKDASARGSSRKVKSDSGGLWGAVMNYIGFDSGTRSSVRASAGVSTLGGLSIAVEAGETQWLSLDDVRYGLVASSARTPASGSTFPHAHHDNSEHDSERGSSRIAGLVLSLWDNLSGPRVEHAWCARHVARETLQQTAPYTLNGEMLDAALDDAAPASAEAAARIEHKVLVLAQHGVVCLLFCARHRGALARFSLSLVLERSVLARYTALAPILHDRLAQLVELYRSVALLDLPAPVVLHVLDALVVRLLPPLHALLDARTLCAPVPFHRTLFAHTALSATHKALLARALTALTQSGALVVLGGDVAQIATWLCTLAQFLSPTQRQLASVRVRSGSGAYVPDLALQGVLCAREAAVLEAEALVQGVRPVAVLDLHALRVLAAHPLHQYAVVRHDFLRHVRHRLLLRATSHTRTPSMGGGGGASSGRAGASRASHAGDADTWTTHPLLHALETPAPLCAAIVERIATLPFVPLYLRQAACAHAHTALLQRAHVLIDYAEALFEAAFEQHARAPAPVAPPIDEFTVGLVERASVGPVAVASAHAPGAGVSARGHTTELRSPAVASLAPPVHATRVPRQIARLAQLHTRRLQLHTPPLQPQTPLHASTAGHGATPLGAGAAVHVGDGDSEAARVAAALDPRETRRRLRHALGLSEADLLVLLGLADTLQPGTYLAVAGNPAWIEEKLVRAALSIVSALF